MNAAGGLRKSRMKNKRMIALLLAASTLCSAGMKSSAAEPVLIQEHRARHVNFADVADNAYYYNAVAWASETGITSGTSATTFSPDAVCTRAQIVTFLWRAYGSQTVDTQENAFTDVSADDYYYDAVQWAVHNGVTSGTSDTTFSPDKSCTRAEAVMFLWRAAGSPMASEKNSAVDAESTRETSYFYDINTQAYYYSAVQWANQNGVTGGTGNNAFSPQITCSRAQIVTFLYHDRIGTETESAEIDTPLLGQATPDRFDRITVTWSAVDDAEGYVVYRRASGETDWTPLAQTDACSWEDTTVATNVRYTYTVSAYDTVDGEKVYSGYDRNGVSGIASCVADQQLWYADYPYVTAEGKPAGATISSGGCGPASVSNLGNNLLGWNTNVPAIAQVAVDSGARYNGGTDINTLLSAMRSSYGGFSYAKSSDDNAVFSDVQNGAMAIIHTNGKVGGQYNQLLANNGHFLCLLRVDGTTATIVDSCSYTGKWTENSVRKTYITQTDTTGVVQCPLSALAAAADYYYVVYPGE